MTVIGSKNIKELSGVVLSAKMDKTIVVKVSSVKSHPVYKKRYMEEKKYYAHDENNMAKEGDTVTIRQTRPMSRLKRRILK